MKKLLNFCYLAFFMPVIASAQGKVTPPPNVVLAVPSVTVSRDTPVGTSLTTAWTTGTIRANNAALNCTFRQEGVVTGTPVPGSPKIFYTNVPGVGVSLGVTQNWRNRMIFGPFVSEGTVENVAQHNWAEAYFYAIGPVSSGTVTSPPKMTVTYTSNCFPTFSYTFTVVSNQITFTAQTCTVLTPTVSAKLPTVVAKNIKDKDSTAGDTGFSVGVNCPTGVNLYITLTDKNNPANQSNVLSLDKSSTASNVGIEVLMNNVVMGYGPASSVAGTINQVKVPGTNYNSIPFVARYKSLGNPTAGTVRAAATMTMSYQ